jgi:hypothetical protein
MKNLLISFSILLNISCATQTVVSNSYQEESGIIVQGDLVGASLSVDTIYIDEIKRSDLRKDKSQMGTQIYDRILKINLKPGKHDLVISKDGSVLFKKEIYILKGQVKRISV